MQPRESRTVPIRACRIWNRTGLLLQKNAEYSLAVPPEQRWWDAWIRTTADGYPPTRLQSPLADRRRAPQANFFKLIGAIGVEDENDDAPPGGPDALLVIGAGPFLLRAASEGELACFANDVSGFYWNNWGSVELTVTRTR